MSQTTGNFGDNWSLEYDRQDSPNTLVFSIDVNSFMKDTDGVCLGWNVSGGSAPPLIR